MSPHWDRIYDHLTATTGRGPDPVRAIVFEVWIFVSDAAGLSQEIPRWCVHHVRRDRGSM